MFEPVSSVEYLRCDSNKQILVCALGETSAAALSSWKDRAAAIFTWDPALLYDVVRDLLHNPQIRAVVIHKCGDPGLRRAFKEAWFQGEWPVTEDHARLVRTYVPVYEETCTLKGVLPPYLPQRVRYS